MVRMLALFVVSLLCVPAFASAGQLPREPKAPEPCPGIGGQPSEDPAQRGCCSWHGGVCGCSGGRPDSVL
jgi:hypothetical protein